MRDATGPSPRRRSSSAATTCSSAKDLDEALEWAAKVPAARTGSVEVRQVMDYEAAGFPNPDRGGGAVGLGGTEAVVDRLFRRESGRAVATLIRILGDFDLAEEAVQEAFVVALERWPRDGLPDNPGAWIVRTARNARHRPPPPRAPLPGQAARARGARPSRLRRRPSDDMSSIPDDRLRLFFTCCHPALAPEARVALTLRTARRALDARGRARVSRPRERDAAAHRARQAQDPRRRHPLRGARGPRAAGPAALGAGRPLPDLQRGLSRDERRHARAPRAVRRGDPAGPRAGGS